MPVKYNEQFWYRNCFHSDNKLDSIYINCYDTGQQLVRKQNLQVYNTDKLALSIEEYVRLILKTTWYFIIDIESTLRGFPFPNKSIKQC